MKPAQLRRLGQRHFRSGPYLPLRARSEAIRVLVVATEHTTEDRQQLSRFLLALQLRRPVVKPVLLIGSADHWPVDSRGIVYETCFDSQALAALGLDIDPGEYRQRRMDSLISSYAPHHVVILAAGEVPSTSEVDRWLPGKATPDA